MRKALYSNEWGKRSGVSILINSQLVTRSGFNVFIHQSADYITKATPIFSLIPRYEHFVRIYPRCNKPDKQFLRLPYESRHCLLPNDKDLALFRQSRCRLLELTKTIHQECGCHPYFMPILEKTEIRNCTARDIGCFKYDSGNSTTTENFYLIEIRRVKLFRIFYLESTIYLQLFGIHYLLIACLRALM